MLSRFIVDQVPVTGARVALSGDELHHAARVARVRVGERVELFDGKGSAVEAVVVVAARNRVEVEVGRTIASRESPLAITLAAALIAPDRFELVLQKGCELGVARFVPVLTARVETRVERIAGKLERWERIVAEAAKQCGRAVLPRLEAPTAFTEVVAREKDLVVFDADGPHDSWPTPPIERLTLLIGPEGGLAPAEIDAARGAGARVCSLGPRRLRAETAAVAAVTAAGIQFGDILSP